MGKSNRSVLGLASSTRQYIARRVFSHSATEKELQNFQSSHPVYLASLLGLPIVPVGIGIDNPWRLNTWDKFAIPRPLSRVRHIFGPKIFIPRKSSREELEAFRIGIQDLTNDLCDAAEDWALSGEKMVGEKPFTRARRTNTIDFSKLTVATPPPVVEKIKAKPTSLPIIKSSSAA